MIDGLEEKLFGGELHGAFKFNNQHVHNHMVGHLSIDFLYGFIEHDLFYTASNSPLSRCDDACCIRHFRKMDCNNLNIRPF